MERTGTTGRPQPRPPRPPRPWRWSRLSEVERVDVYTRQSLYVLLWGMQATFVVLIAARDDGPPGLVVAIAAAAVVMALAATRVMTRVFDAYPDTDHVPWGVAWPLVPLAAAGALALVSAPPGTRFAAATLLYTPLAWALGGVRGRVETVVLLAVCAAVPGLLVLSWGAALYGLLVGGFFVFTVRASLWLLHIVQELERARGAESRLAVAEERLRFSRDVHDVLGRHLSTIGVHAELAARLVERGADPAAASAQMLEVRGMAHEALREARELARGYRATDLGQEVEGARALLASAGVTAVLDAGGVPEAWHEAAGWVIREGVTNVLRHSAATRVDLSYADGVLTLRNDGVTTAPGPDGGSGLVGLADRLEPLGGSVDTRREAGGFVLLARLPGTGPASSPSPTPSPAGAER